MKHLLVAVALLFGLSGLAHATEIELKGGPTLVAYDGDISTGVGGSLFLGGEVDAEKGIGAELELALVKADVLSPFGGSTKIAEIESKSVFLNITKKIDSPSWFGDKVSADAKVGLGAIFPDVNSAISGVNFDGEPSPAVQTGLSGEWLIHQGEGGEAGYEQFNISLVGSATYVWNDLNINADMGGPTTRIKNVDGDHGKVFVGLKAFKKI